MKEYKLYLLYLVLDKEELDKYQIMSIKPYNIELPYEKDDNVRFIETPYAMCIDKDEVNRFLEVRNKKKFRVEVEYYDNEEIYNEATGVYSSIAMMELDIDKNTSMLVTESEFELIDECAREIDEFLVESSIYEYANLKKKYVKALDILAYTYFYSVFNSCDDKRGEFADYQLQYYVSVEGAVSSNFYYAISNISALVNSVISYTMK